MSVQAGVVREYGGTGGDRAMVAAGTYCVISLRHDERALRGLLQFFVCADARRLSSEEVPLRLRYRELVTTAFQLPEVRAVALAQSSAIASQKLAPGVTHNSSKAPDVVDLEDGDKDLTPTPATSKVPDKGPGEAQPPGVAAAVFQAVEAVEAAEAAEAEAEAVAREEALRRALTVSDTEEVAKRKRVEARQMRAGQNKWNFGGSPPTASNDRFRENEADLEMHRKRQVSGTGARAPESAQQGLKRRLQERRELLAEEVQKLKKQRNLSGSREALQSDDIGDRPSLSELRGYSSMEDLHDGEDMDDSAKFGELEALRTITPPTMVEIECECEKARQTALEQLRATLAQELAAAGEERQRAEDELQQRQAEEAQILEALRQAVLRSSRPASSGAAAAQ
ncbi:unnamed protein product [Polarella glacialis]|uniref:Uncharacterized protein n=1 Tax=Polarella glacialis TaxID=89957 RepID=A0A813H2W4_POLGL|nr:unnamed protein product [Polarella glacialis]